MRRYNLSFILLLLLLLPVLKAQSGDETNRYMLAQSFEQSGEHEKAMKLYEALYTQSPGNVMYLLGYNRALVQLKKYDASEKVLRNEVRKNPSDVNLLTLLGKTLFLMGRENETFALWREYLNGNPQQNLFRHFSNASLELRAFDKAIEFLETGRRTSPDKLLFTMDIAQLYLLQMNYTAASKEYVYLLSRDASQMPAVFGRITTLTTKSDFVSAALEVFAPYEKEPAFAPVVAYLLFETKDYKKSVSLYKEMDKQQQRNGSELLGIADRLQSVNAFAEAGSLYEYLMQEYPRASFFPALKLGFARCREQALINEEERTGDFWKPFRLQAVKDSAEKMKVIQSYLEIAASYPSSETGFESFYRAALLYRSVGLKEKALPLLHKITGEYPLSPLSVKSFDQLAEIALAEGDSLAAREYYTAQFTAPAADESARNKASYNIAMLNFYQGNFPDARLLLETIGVDERDPFANDALELNMLMNPALSDSGAVVQYAVAEWLITTGKYEQALSQLGACEGNQSFLVAERALLRKVQVLTALNRYTEALLAAATLTPEKAKLYGDDIMYLTGLIYVHGLKDPARAIGVFQQLLISYPNSLYCSSAREQIISLTKKQS